MNKTQMLVTYAVAYLRLSVEDGDDKESTSIGNQRRIIDNYAKENNIIITEYYIDDGYSGYTMSRPDFNRLKEDLNNEKIHTIIVKDASRLGRHNAKVQLFLENILETGNRILLLDDGYDTADEKTHDMIGIKTWFNERFIIDTSRKIRNSIAALQRDGKWICSVPYGFKKDPFDKNKYEIDPITAGYVEQIFDMYLNGMGLHQICKRLSQINVPTPAMIKKQYQEERGVVSKRKSKGIWDATTVSRILKNDFYIGTLTLSKSKRRSINGKQIEIPKEEWKVFPGAHKPIVDLQTFSLAQKVMADRSAFNYRGQKNKKVNPFSGLLYCADCGEKMTSKGGEHTRYICKTYNVLGTKKCSSHAINEITLAEALMEILKHCKGNLTHVINDIDKIIQAEMQSKTQNKPANTDNLVHKLGELQQELEILIQQKVRDTMKNPTMAEMIAKTYDDIQDEKLKEMKMIERQVLDSQVEELDEVQIKNGLNNAVAIIDDILTTKKLTKKQVLMLVDRINVHEDNGLDVMLKGDLHELCNNYFRASDSRMAKIKKHICEYVLDNPEKILTPDVVIYVRDKGVRLAYQTVSTILKDELLANGLIEYRKSHRGYKVIGAPEDVLAQLITNHVVGITRWLRNNNDIIGIAHKIVEWIEGTKYKNNRF